MKDATRYQHQKNSGVTLEQHQRSVIAFSPLSCFFFQFFIFFFEDKKLRKIDLWWSIIFFISTIYNIYILYILWTIYSHQQFEVPILFTFLINRSGWSTYIHHTCTAAAFHYIIQHSILVLLSNFFNQIPIFVSNLHWMK